MIIIEERKTFKHKIYFKHKFKISKQILSPSKHLAHPRNKSLRVLTNKLV